MLELYIIRHGLAGKSLPKTTEDAVRPLTKKGKVQLKKVAKGLKKRKISFDVVVSSPLLRAKETAEIAQDYCGNSAKVKLAKELLPESSFPDLVQFINKLKKAKKVALVGHEPFLSGFASYCLSKSKASFLTLKKAGILKLEFEDKVE